MGPESTVWAENGSKSMPGPLRSVWDGSNPLKGAVPGEKSQKVCSKTAREMKRRPQKLGVWLIEVELGFAVTANRSEAPVQ